MANRSITFNGKTYGKPGVYSAVESTMTYSKQSEGANIIALIGESTGGEPDTVHFFNNPSTAKKVLKSGELLKACQKAWNPVSKTKDGLALGGADVIACIRSNKATRAQARIFATEAKDAVVNDVIQHLSEESTGTIAVTGSYTNASANTYIVEIVSSGEISTSGTFNNTGVTFNYSIASEGSDFVSSNDIEVVQAGYVIPSSGLTVSFAAGKYMAGDSFIISAYPAVTTATEKFVVVSKDYGKDNNKIQVKFEDGTAEGTKKATVYDVKTNSYEVFDNLGLAFKLTYTGEAAYAAVSVITDGKGNAIKLQTQIGATKESAIADLDVDLDKTTFSSIQALVRHLQGYENYGVEYNVHCNPLCGVKDLDCVSDASIKGSGHVLTQVLSDLKTRLDNDSSFITIEITNKEISTLDNLPFFSLSGGTNGKTPSSWVKYFELLSKYDIKYIVPLTSDELILEECAAHVKEMSETLGLERRMVCGSDNGKTVTEASAMARSLSHGRVQYVYPGFYDLNSNGETELYPPYILAAQFAGRVSALPDGETATYDVFKMSGIERELEPDEIIQLLNSGVVPFEFKISTSSYEDSYVQCVQDITTSQENDMLQVERSIGVIADNINREIRAAIKPLVVGKKMGVGMLTTIKNIVVRILEKKRDKEEVILAFKDVDIYTQDNAMFVSYACAPAQPNNFTFVTGHFYSEDLMLADGNE